MPLLASFKKSLRKTVIYFPSYYLYAPESAHDSSSAPVRFATFPHNETVRPRWQETKIVSAALNCT
jgi:hypothetical protein